MNFDQFVRSLGKDSRVAILHDTDPDGVCSAVIVAKAVEKITGNKTKLRVHQDDRTGDIFDETIKKLKENKINRLIITDKPIDYRPEGVLIAEKFSKILIIDHHKKYTDINNENICLLKEGSYYPSSKIAFDYFSRYVNLEDLDWLAAAGLITDYAFKYWGEFLDKVFKRYNIKKTKDIFTNELGEIGSIIKYAEVYNLDNVQEIFDIIYNAKNPRDVHKSNLKKYYDKVKIEVDKAVKEFNKKKEVHGDLDWYEVKSKYPLTSVISSIISAKDQSRTLVITQNFNGRYNVSARRQDQKIAVNDILSEAVVGFENASGGGHKTSAGSVFNTKDYVEFKKRVLNDYKKIKAGKY